MSLAALTRRSAPRSGSNPEQPKHQTVTRAVKARPRRSAGDTRRCIRRNVCEAVLRANFLPGLVHRALVRIIWEMGQQEHWERVYRERAASALSWYQPQARLSLDLIARVAPERARPIIDVGGGASTLVDGLLDAGYQSVTILDLAPAALAVAQQRLGERAARVSWMAANVLDAPLPATHYDVWHDRAVFHFLTDPADRARYIMQAHRAVRPGGHIVVASFGLDGPTRCSGLDVVRYSPDTMHAEFGNGFRLLDSVREDHHTPAGAVQAFVCCLCRVGGDDGTGTRRTRSD